MFRGRCDVYLMPEVQFRTLAKLVLNVHCLKCLYLPGVQISICKLFGQRGKLGKKSNYLTNTTKRRTTITFICLRKRKKIDWNLKLLSWVIFAKVKALFTWRRLVLADQVTRQGASLQGGRVNLFTRRELGWEPLLHGGRMPWLGACLHWRREGVGVGVPG